MELNSELFGNAMSQEAEKANAQKRMFAEWAAPLQWGSMVVLDDWATMWVFKARTWIFRICELFGMRDDSWLTIRKMNDMKFLKQFWVLEERNWKYLDEIIDICNEKWVELYNTAILAEVWYVMKKKESVIEYAPTYAPINIEQVMAPVVGEEEQQSASTKWDEVTKKVLQDMDISMVDISALELMDVSDVQLIYKRVTGKWISPLYRNNKSRFVEKLTELKSI